MVRLAGTDRRTRLITGGTMLALLVAVLAFVALDADDEIPRDDYTVMTDSRCVNAKREIATATAQAAGQDVQALAARLVPMIVAWRSDFRAEPVPNDRLEEAQRLDAALRNVEIELAALARTDPDARSRVVAQAGRVDRAATSVEAAVADLNLESCERLLLGITRRDGG